MSRCPASDVANTNHARVLLRNGASANCPDEDRDTPLHAVIKSRRVEDPTEFDVLGSQLLFSNQTQH